MDDDVDEDAGRTSSEINAAQATRAPSCVYPATMVL
jgi:hypothetical protein